MPYIAWQSCGFKKGGFRLVRVWVRGPQHELKVEVAARESLAHVVTGGPEGRASHDLNSSELVLLVRAGDAGLVHQLFASALQPLGRLFSHHNNMEDQDDVEEETAGHHFALY